MKRRYQEEGLDALCEDLRRLDPEHYEVVDRQNHRRVIHALEICYQTGKTYTSFRTQDTTRLVMYATRSAIFLTGDFDYNGNTTKTGGCSYAYADGLSLVRRR